MNDHAIYGNIHVMRHATLLMCLLGFSWVSCKGDSKGDSTRSKTRAQSPAMKLGSAERKSVKREAEKMFAALLKDDLETLADYTYPSLIKKMGGRVALLSALRKSLADVKKRGFSIKSAEVGEPLRAVKAGQELHVLLPAKTAIGTPKGVLHINAHMIGVSRDQGKTWTFVNTSKFSADFVRKLFPVFNPALKIPALAKPKFVTH